MLAAETLPTEAERQTHAGGDVKGTGFYCPELDALRFLAFVSVFLCHGLQVVGPHAQRGVPVTGWRFLDAVTEAGNFGVCMFFLLSSYLITSLLELERRKTNTIHLKSFYLRRILRIWPLYFTITALFAGAGYFYPTVRMGRDQVLAYTLLLGNWYIAAHALTNLQLNWLWSISVEEQFYLLWPFLAKIGGTRTIAVLSTLLIPTAVLAIATISRGGQNLSVTVWLNSLVQSQYFALGALLAIGIKRSTVSSRWVLRFAMGFSGIVCWLVASGFFRIKSRWATPSPLSMCLGYVLVAIGSVLVFLSILGISSRYVPRSAIYLGKISYGLYVFHGIALSATTAVRHLFWSGITRRAPLQTVAFLSDRAVAFALTVALATLSYKYLETPFLLLKRRFEVIKSRAV
jgi:peptidoglycan/LPS O-acetylase OafA/YrhL